MKNMNIAREAEAMFLKLMETIESDFPLVYKKANVSKDEATWCKDAIKVMIDYYCNACSSADEAEETVSEKEFFKPVAVVDFSKDIDRALKAIDENWEELKRIDNICKKRGTILGRYFTISVGDGNAVYQITALKNNAVYVVVCDVDSDGYTDLVLGEESWMERSLAEQLIESRDRMAEFFQKHK